MNKKNCLTFKHGVLIFLLTVNASSALAAPQTKTQRKQDAPTTTPASANTELTVSVGNLCEYIGKIQTDEQGSSNLCSFMPSLAASLDYKLTPQFALFPQIGATLPKSGRDENISRMTLFILMNVRYITSFMNFFGGTGLYFTRVSGNGGEAILNNGSSTESFPLPKDAVYSRNLILNLGGSYNFNEEWSGELYTYIFNVESSEDRAFSAGVSLSYHFGGVL